MMLLGSPELREASVATTSFSSCTRLRWLRSPTGGECRLGGVLEGVDVERLRSSSFFGSVLIGGGELEPEPEPEWESVPEPMNLREGWWWSSLRW